MRKFEGPKKPQGEAGAKDHKERNVAIRKAFENAPDVIKRWIHDALEEQPDMTVEELGEYIVMLWLEGGGGIEMTPDVRKAVRSWIAARIVASR